MKLVLIFGFIAVASAYPRGGVITKSAYTGGYGVITRGVITKESILDNAKCNGPQCSGGCCPESAYVCCESGSFCASTLEECPIYSEVPNRRADQNKRAGLEESDTLLAYLLSKLINEQGGIFHFTK